MSNMTSRRLLLIVKEQFSIKVHLSPLQTKIINLKTISPKSNKYV